MIKSKTGGNTVKFSSTPTGSRTVSREQSMQARSHVSGSGSQRGDGGEGEEDEDEVIAPPKSRTRAEREAEATTPAPGAEEEEVLEAEEEEEELPAQSWGAMMGYSQVEDDADYGYDDIGDDW